MAQNSYKAQALALDIQSTMTVRLSGLATPLAVSAGFDPADGNPLLTIGTNVAGSAGGIMKLRPVAWPLALDALGNAAILYTPHVAQIVMEAEAAVQASWINSLFVRYSIVTEATSRGLRVECYKSANGVAPTVAAITGTPDATIEPNLQYPLVSSM